MLLLQTSELILVPFLDALLLQPMLRHWLGLPEVSECSAWIAELVERVTSEFGTYNTTNAAMIAWYDRMIDPNRTYAQSVRGFKR